MHSLLLAFQLSYYINIDDFKKAKEEGKLSFLTCGPGSPLSPLAPAEPGPP